MPTTTEYLTQLIKDKDTLVDNLNSKGISAQKSETFTQLVPKVLDINSENEDWKKPEDWQDISQITIDASTPIVLLVDDARPRISFRIQISSSSGSGTVYWDWDMTKTAEEQTCETTTVSGTTEVFAHAYPTSNGDKHIVVYRPNGNYNVTRFHIYETDRTIRYKQNWLWLRLFSTNLTNLQWVTWDYQGINANMVTSTNTLQCCELVGTADKIINAGNAFYFCGGLEKVILPQSMNVCTNCSSMFQSCFKLRKITIPAMPKVTSFNYMMLNCGSLTEIKFNATEYPALRSLTYAFAYTSIESIELPNFPKADAMGYMFYYCIKLKDIIPYDNNWLSLTTTIAGLIGGCMSIQNKDFSMYNAPNVTNVQNMFIANTGNLGATKFPMGLQKLTTGATLSQLLPSADIMMEEFWLPETAYATSKTSITFNPTNIYNLKKLHIKCGMNAQRVVVDGYSTGGALEEVTIPTINATYGGASPQISFKNQALSREAILDIFNQLPTLSGKTIAITGCKGASELSDEDIAIATSKGWSVTR